MTIKTAMLTLLFIIILPCFVTCFINLDKLEISRVANSQSVYYCYMKTDMNIIDICCDDCDFTKTSHNGYILEMNRLQQITLNITDNDIAMSAPLFINCGVSRGWYSDEVEDDFTLISGDSSIEVKLSNYNKHGFILFHSDEFKSSYRIVRKALKTYTLDKLNENVLYQICVAIINDKGESHKYKCRQERTAALLSVRKDHVASVEIKEPDKVRSVTFLHVNMKSFKVSWDKPEVTKNNENISYTIALYKNNSILKQNKTSKTYLIFSLLNYSTKYCVTIYAENQAGTSKKTKLKCIVTTQDLLNNQAFISILIMLISGIAFCFVINLFSKHIQKEESLLPQFNGIELRVIPSSSEKTEIQLKSLIHEYEKLCKISVKMAKTNALTLSKGNLKKQMYPDNTTYDHTRIKLLKANMVNDFISANGIPFLENPNFLEYIACQSPIKGSLDSFIQMLWEQNITCIIMIAQLDFGSEGDKHVLYFPEITNKVLEFENQYTMCLKYQSVDGSFIERNLVLTNLETNEARSIFHLQIHTWLETSKPDIQNFYDLVLKFHFTPIEEISPPYLVHCSDGVGRTGTFIALDRIIQKILNGNRKINIYDTVLQLRYYRAMLVNKDYLYVFIHEFVEFFKTTIPERKSQD